MNNYRPISLLPCMSKIIEKVVHRRLYNFCEMQGLIFNKQFGFRPKCSTIDAVSNFVANILSNMEKSLQFRYYWISLRRLIQLTIIYYLRNYSTMVLEGWLWSGSVVTYLVEANMLNIMIIFLNLDLSHVGFLRVRYLALFYLLFIQMTFQIL